MKNFLIKYKLEAIGVLIGAAGGWCYWYFVGCSSGSCAITSSPINSSLYGSVLGGAIFNMFSKEEKKENNTNN